MEQRKIIPLESSNKISSMAKYLKVGETFVPRNETSEGGGSHRDIPTRQLYLDRKEYGRSIRADSYNSVG